MRRFVLAVIQLTFSCYLALAAASMANAVERLPDVRLLIDVSGSMRESDPDNLREPALDLMLRLLPEGSRAGVWTFGQRVNMPVQHRAVDQQWREDAAAAVGEINNHGLFTNIPDALELATFDAQRLRYEYRTSVILLTDGKVDISESDIENARAARDVLTKHAIELRDLGIQVHTIALSDNADWEFLRELARVTGGLAEKAESPEALSAVFLQALDIAAPTEQVPLLGGEFLIDDSVREFTLLVFPEDGTSPVSLNSPDGARFDTDNPSSRVSWFEGHGFFLVTVTDPEPGTWRVRAPAAIARVNVLSNLSLLVEGLDTSMPAGHQPEIGISLRDSQATVTDADLLLVLGISVVISRDDGERWTVEPDFPEVPASGEFRLALPMLEEVGRYEVLVSLDGGSFQRQVSLVTDVYAPELAVTVPELPEPEPQSDRGWLLPAGITALLLVAVLGWWIRGRSDEEEGDEEDWDEEDGAYDDMLEDDDDDLVTGISTTEPRDS